MSDRLHKRNGTWHTWGYDADGVRWHESTQQTDRKAAVAVARDIARRRASPADAAREAATLADAVGLFLADVKGRVRAGKRSEATLGFYTQKTGHWRRILGDDFRLAKLHARDVDRAITQRRSEPRASESTIAKELIALRRVLKVAIRAGLWTGDPASVLPVSAGAEYTPRSRWLPLEEVRALLGELAAPDAARVAWIVATSACAGEADRARPTDATPCPDLGYLVKIHGTKTSSRDRTVAVVLPEAVALLEYALVHAEVRDGRMFRAYDPHTSNARRTLHRACRRAGIAPCSENDLRRTCAQWLRRAGVPLEHVSATLGHATTTMVQRVYGRLDATAVGQAILRATGASGAATHLQQQATQPVESVEGVEGSNPLFSSGSSGDRTQDRRIKSPQGRGIAILLPRPKKPHANTCAKGARATHLQQRRARGGGR